MIRYNITSSTDIIRFYLFSQIKQGHFEVIDQIKRQYPEVYNKFKDAIDYFVKDTLAKEFINMIQFGKIEDVKLFIQQHPDVIPYAIDSIYMYNLSNSFDNPFVNEQTPYKILAQQMQLVFYSLYIHHLKN